MKKLVIPTMLLALLLAIPHSQAQAQAQQPPQPSQQDLQKLTALHDQLWAKKMEIKALTNAGEVEKTKVATDEAIKLKTQIREERTRLGLPEKGSGFKKDKRKRDGKAPKNGKSDGKKTEKRQ